MDKPEGRKAGWELQGTERPFEATTLTLRKDRLKLPKKDDFSFEYVERAAGVLIVPVTRAGEIVLIRQYRYPIDQWCLEIPAGGAHDTGDTPLDEVARKELREEVGADAGEIEKLGTFYSSPAFSDEKCHVFIAWDVELAHPSEQESTEAIETQVTPVQEALKLARTGGMINAACALCLWWAEARLRERGLLK